MNPSNSDFDEILNQNPREGAIWFMGMLLISTQAAEFYLSFALRVVFKEEALTIDDFSRKDKKTLGMMIHELRKRFELDPSFDDLLRGFLEQRNIFVHELRHQEWFDLDSKEGVDLLWQFLGNYQRNLEQVANTFVAYAMKLVEEYGVPMSAEKRLITESGYLPYLKERYYPLLSAAIKRIPKQP